MGIKTITVNRWRSVCKHVKTAEAEYWARDNLCTSEINKFVKTHLTGEEDDD